MVALPVGLASFSEDEKNRWGWGAKKMGKVVQARVCFLWARRLGSLLPPPRQVFVQCMFSSTLQCFLPHVYPKPRHCDGATSTKTSSAQWSVILLLSVKAVRVVICILSFDQRHLTGLFLDVSMPTDRPALEVCAIEQPHAFTH